MASNNLSGKILSGMAWTYFERLLSQGVSVLVTIILARLLLPEQYGVVSIVTVFITLCDALVVGGFSDTLIQKRGADQLDFSTLFWFVLVLGIVMYGVVFTLAPYIQLFFKNTSLVCETLRVMAIRIPINAVQSIQSARISKRMEYRYFFFANLAGTLASALVGIYMAFAGFGVWALVAQYLISSFVGTLVIWFSCGWRPDFAFSAERLKYLYSVGWKMQCSSLLAAFYGELESICIGKKYTAADLAFYDKGKQFPRLIMENVQTTISKVMLPAFSTENNDIAAMKALAKRSIRIGTFVISPLLVGLIMCADEFVHIVLTEKWMASVPFLRLICLYYILQPLMTLNKQIVIAVGQTKLYLMMEIQKKLIGIFLLCVALFASDSVLMIAVSSFINQCIGLVIQSYPLKRIINYPIAEQLSDFLPALISAALMAAAVWCVGLLPLPTFLILVVKIAVGIAVYVLIALITKNESFTFLLNTLKKVLHK